MSASIIDGKKIAEGIRLEVARQVEERLAKGKPAPGLATVLVGEDTASTTYIKSKHKACEQVGIHSINYDLPTSASQGEVERIIHTLNADKRVHGILVQLPLPGGMNVEAVLGQVAVEKDVDGFHPMNIGRLAQKGRTPLFIPCTPAGVLHLLKHSMPSMEGKRAVVLGRSNIVGMPVALLLVRENCTVTICHSRTVNLPELVRTCELVVAAMGQAEMVRGDWIKPGAVVVDVGMNRVEDETVEKGYRLVGDVAFDEVKEVAGAITPVPGGVGPMTIAMLLKNTLLAAERTS
jgi:5,10-methylene-tetrahydrofolate dehydrogenase/methenyl tetrahydrofolate cyclohydrolase